jgi:rhodanese-related sulfurtransferase
MANEQMDSHTAYRRRVTATPPTHTAGWNKNCIHDCKRATDTTVISRLLATAVLVLALSGCAEPPYNNLDNEQLQTLLEQGTPIYDIRRPEEWHQTGVVANSQLLTFVDGRGRVLPDFMQRFTSAVQKDDPVVLICQTGGRTSTLARYLVEKLGYTQVYNVRDGITRWIRDDLPVTRL